MSIEQESEQFLIDEPCMVESNSLVTGHLDDLYLNVYQEQSADETVQLTNQDKLQTRNEEQNCERLLVEGPMQVSEN